MTDDELIMLWSLGGMELWAEFQRVANIEEVVWWRHYLYYDRDNYRTFLSPVDLFPVALFLYQNRFYFTSYLAFDAENLYVIDDILTFNPDERWWKLLFAKRWYSKNREQFHDG